jgi:hypothetical protein
MGYSLIVDVRNVQLEQKMLKFMSENYHKWSDIIESKTESVGVRDISNDVSYGQKKGVIGFDYASHCYGWERNYVYCLTKWIALKIGKRKSKFKMDSGNVFEFEKPIPYISYDGCEYFPIVVVANEREALSVSKKMRWCCVDSFGVYISAKINESLISNCEEMFDNYDMAKAFGEDMKKLILQKVDKNWHKKHMALKAKYAKPEIDQMLPKVRNEIKRLDELWKQV